MPLYTLGASRTAMVLTVVDRVGLDPVLIIVHAKYFNSIFKQGNIEVRRQPKFEPVDQLVLVAKGTGLAKKHSCCCLRTVFLHNL